MVNKDEYIAAAVQLLHVRGVP